MYTIISLIYNNKPKTYWSHFNVFKRPERRREIFFVQSSFHGLIKFITLFNSHSKLYKGIAYKETKKEKEEERKRLRLNSTLMLNVQKL